MVPSVCATYVRFSLPGYSSQSPPSRCLPCSLLFRLFFLASLSASVATVALPQHTHFSPPKRSKSTVSRRRRLANLANSGLDVDAAKLTAGGDEEEVVEEEEKKRSTTACGFLRRPRTSLRVGLAVAGDG